MNNTPLISVIVPCYNVENYLDNCVKSIMNQTYANLEIFLVDDGALDNTGKICDKYALMDNRIKVIHKPNGGLSDARNVAIDVAQGEYLTFIDSDDTVDEDYVETLYRMASENKAQMAITLINTFYEGSAPEKIMNEGTVCEVFDVNEALKKMFYQHEIDTTAPAKLYHRSLFTTGIRYPKGLLYEDLATTYRYMRCCDRIAYRNRQSYNYLVRKTSIEGSNFKPLKYESCMKIIQQLEEDRRSFSPSVQKAVDCRIVSFAFHILLDIPSQYQEYRKTLFAKVKALRWRVMMDRNARRKARVACLLSLGGLGMVSLFAKKGKSRKQ